MGFYGVTDDLKDEIEYWKSENKMLKETIVLLEQKLNKIDKKLENSRKGLLECFKTINETKQ